MGLVNSSWQADRKLGLDGLPLWASGGGCIAVQRGVRKGRLLEATGGEDEDRTWSGVHEMGKIERKFGVERRGRDRRRRAPTAQPPARRICMY
jgi:hypothetical protein